MKVALLRVGIDSGSGGCQGPLFDDHTFEFVPIPDYYAETYNCGEEDRTYGNTLGRQGRYLAQYVTARLLDRAMHVDPEWRTFTYGTPSRPQSGLRSLEKGDLLVFYAGLEGWEWHSPPALYIVGYFDVLAAGVAADFEPTELVRLFGENAHLRHQCVYESYKDRLVLVKGSSNSRLLSRAVCISEMGRDVDGKSLKVLSQEMQRIFGSFGGRNSIQRALPRWVGPANVESAADFVKSLM